MGFRGAVEASVVAAREGAGNMNAGDFRKLVDEDRIVAAIREAEQQTSGEIRVFISNGKIEDAVGAAQTTFVKLGMTKTSERNGVLIFVVPWTRRLAVIGDESIYERCGVEFWQELASEISVLFKSSRFSDGVVQAVHKAGKLLAQHFPREPDDHNELSDDVARD